MSADNIPWALSIASKWPCAECLDDLRAWTTLLFAWMPCILCSRPAFGLLLTGDESAFGVQ